MTAANNKLVMDFYTLAFVKGNVEEAFDKYIGDTYIQHDPGLPDGKEAAVEFLSKLFSNPQMNVSIKRVIAEDELVALHVHSKSSPDDPGQAIVEIYRVEKGKIVEHWGVFQTVPEKSANKNTMF
jgi:predicted SnoaL-like aldol condensation-catalyzing enzyme